MNRTSIDADLTLFPKELHPFLRDAEIFDSSCSEEARVYYIERDGGLFLKRNISGKLKAEAEMTAYFHALGLSAQVLAYLSTERYDWLLTRRIPGEDCTHLMYRSDPLRLCDTVASCLRMLHEVHPDQCPVKGLLETYRSKVVSGSRRGLLDEPEKFRDLWPFSSAEEARRCAEEALPALKSDVLIHGDYCLPNILLADWHFSGFIDVGSGGIADRHIDILWGIWSLMYNLRTTRYTDRFLDVYGRDLVSMDLLRGVAAMELIMED